MIILHAFHEGGLFGFVHSLEERINEIKISTPAKEHELRLKLIREMTDADFAALPKEFVKSMTAYGEAVRAYGEAVRVRDEAWHVYDDAWRVYGDAWRVYYEAGRAYDEAERVHKPAIVAWHKNACGCAYFENGESIFTE